MEIGTDNFLLQKAFTEENRHGSLNDIFHHFLYRNGLGHIWENVKSLTADYLKSKIDQRQRNRYRQYYASYIQDNLASTKSVIVKLCTTDGVGVSEKPE